MIERMNLGVVKQRIELRLGRAIQLERAMDQPRVYAEMPLGQIGVLRVSAELTDATEDALVDELVTKLAVEP